MIKIKQYVLFAVVCLAFAAANVCAAAVLRLEPAEGAFEISEVFEVKVFLDAEGQDTDGVDITYLNYPEKVLEAQDSDIDTAGIQIEPGSLFVNTMTNNVLPEEGRINFSQITSPGSHFSGSGVLAVITFKAIANGRAELYFDAEPDSTRDCNVAGAGQDLLVTASGAVFAVGDVSDIPVDESEDRPGDDLEGPEDIEDSGQTAGFLSSRTALFILMGLLVVLLIVLIALKKKQSI